jgi:hypothetical protein
MNRPDSIEEALNNSNALVVSFAAMGTVNSFERDKEIEIIEYRNLLHQGDLAALKQVVWEISEKKPKKFISGEIDVVDLKRALLEE